MLDVWTYFRWKSEKNPAFRGSRYYLMLGASILGAFGLFLLGASQMYLRISSLRGRILLFSTFSGWLLFLIFGFGWMEVWERYKDPYGFLAKYCAAIQTLFITLVLNSTIVDMGRSIALYKLAVLFSSDSLLIHYYILASVILIVVYLTPIGRNLWVRRLTGLIPPVNMVLICAMGIRFDIKWTEYGLGTMLLTLMLNASGVFPQLYWAFGPRTDYTRVLSVLKLLRSAGNSFVVHKVRRVGSPAVYRLLFLKERMVFFRVPSLLERGIEPRATLGGTMASDGVGATFETELEKELHESLQKSGELGVEGFSKASVDELVRMDKKNFEIQYEDVSGIEVKESKTNLERAFRTGVLIIDGKKKLKFDVAPNQEFEKCEEVIRAILPKKLYESDLT